MMHARRRLGSSSFSAKRRPAAPQRTAERGAAIWALGRLDRDRLAKLAATRPSEEDPSVEAEWTAALVRRA